MKKISILGPECSGKTSLAKELSKELGCPWVPEIARAYLREIDRKYVFEDLLKIAQLQYQAEVNLLQSPIVLCDTDMTTIYLWSIDKFGRADAELERLFLEVHYDGYILCYPDMTWEPDGLREDQGRRAELFELYENTLREAGRDFVVVKGSIAERVAIARTYLDDING